MRALKLFVLTSALCALIAPLSVVQGQAPSEAPAGFDNVTNGHLTQAEFDAALEVFNEREGIADGLGPIYNSDSCGQCHGNPVVGGISQITELRAGHFNGTNFVDHPGGSLINDRAIDAALTERIQAGNEVRTFRTSLNVLGDGFIEAIDSNQLLAIANAQPGQSGGQITGRFIQVPVNESNNAVRGGRFGWKNQHASLISFSADAYLNEMGITSPLQPNENTRNGVAIPRCPPGVTVGACDPVADPEDDGDDVEIFADFMRSTKVPPRDASATSQAALNGSTLFNQVGCAICHVRTFTTVRPGTVINQGALTVDAAIGNKTFHPFSDFLLHNVGTGDGIVQNGGQATRNDLRTPPLWGMRTRARLMHDGETLNRNEAILRHAGEATNVINNYRALSDAQKANLIAFLDSL